MTEPDSIDEQTLLDLGFERYTEEWEPEGWYRSGLGDYVLWSTPNKEPRWQLRIWSGLGDGESYGFKVESPSERQLRLIVQALTEDGYESEKLKSTSWTEVG